jgi:hypothetical protein
MKVGFRALLATFLIAASFAANAVTMGLSPSQGDYGWQGESVGNRFTVNQDIWVRALGVWDQGQDGLANAYRVVVFDSGGTSLASADVAAGTAATLQNGTRWANLAVPLQLTAGSEYTVVTFRPNFADLFQWVDAANVTVAPEINLLDDMYDSGHAGDGITPIFPTSAEGRDGIFGPNMQFALQNPLAGIPTLGEWGLIVLSLLLAGAAAWHMRRLPGRA